MANNQTDPQLQKAIDEIAADRAARAKAMEAARKERKTELAKLNKNPWKEWIFLLSSSERKEVKEYIKELDAYIEDLGFEELHSINWEIDLGLVKDPVQAIAKSVQDIELAGKTSTNGMKEISKAATHVLNHTEGNNFSIESQNIANFLYRAALNKLGVEDFQNIELDYEGKLRFAKMAHECLGLLPSEIEEAARSLKLDIQREKMSERTQTRAFLSDNKSDLPTHLVAAPVIVTTSKQTDQTQPGRFQS